MTKRITDILQEGLREFLLRNKNISDKFVDKFKTQFYFQ